MILGTRAKDAVYWRCLEQINAGRDTAPGSGANYKFLTVNNFTQELSHQAQFVSASQDAL